jgi:hypothetical protein
MSTRVEYGVQVTRPEHEPITYPARSLADANEIQQGWSAAPHHGATYAVVSRTVSDWTPVDPMEARP